MNKADVVYIHTEILSHKNKEILPFATIQMDLEDVILSEISQKEKDKSSIISLICGV